MPRLQRILACALLYVLALQHSVDGEPGPGAGGPGAGGPGGPGGAATTGIPCPKGNGQVIQLRSMSDTEYTIFTSGCPQYSPYNQTTGYNATYQNHTITFRRTPVLSANVTYIARLGAGNATNSAALLGPIGFAVNGVAIYNDADALLRDAYVYEGNTFDGCRGHANPSGEYHYHSEPGQGCVYNDTAGQHSPLYGVMLDSVPIFGALGDGGVPPTNLDECGGHVDSTYPFYHYHVTYNMTPPYVIKCFKGCIFSGTGNPAIPASSVKTDATCVKAAAQYNYTPLASKLAWLSLPVSPASSPAPPPPSSGSVAACRRGWGLTLLLASALAMVSSRILH